MKETYSMNKKEFKGLKSLATTLILLISVLVIIMSASLGGVGIHFLNQSMKVFLNEYETAGYKMELKSEVQAANAVVKGFYNQFRQGKLSEEEAKHEAIEAVRSMRYRDDETGYIWIDNIDYTLVMHPILSEEEGTNRFELTDKNGVKIIQDIVKTAKSGGGYNEFYFTKSDGETVAPKITYSSEFEPWNWVITTGNYMDDMRAEMASSEQEIHNKFNNMIAIFCISSIIILIISLIIAIISGKRVTRNIKKVEDNLKRTAEGDLNFVIDEKLLNRADEIGAIARSVQYVKQSLTNIIGNISNTGDNLKNSSESFNEKFKNITSNIKNADEALEELAQRATMQASDTEVVNEKIQELEQVIEVEQEEVKRLGQTVSVMMECSNSASENIDFLNDIIRITTDAIQVEYAQIKKNTESAKNINKAVEIIKGIAGEINLLSLNSSIESARAGQAGKGFAVVSEEIRKLAEKSNNSAEVIEKIVRELTENVETSADNIQEVVNNIDKQLIQLDKTQKAFNGLYKEVKTVEDIAKGISSQTDVLYVVKKVVAETAASLTTSVEQNAASTQETSASMQYLSNTVRQCTEDTQALVDLSKKQNEQTSKFKL